MKHSVNDLIEIFKALSDKTRLRIFLVLHRANCELCVCEIIDAIEASQYNVSRHLRIMRSAGLVKENKQGRFVFYSLSPTAEKVHKSFIHLYSSLSDNIVTTDAKRLDKRLSLRKDGKCIVGMTGKKVK